MVANDHCIFPGSPQALDKHHVRARIAAFSSRKRGSPGEQRIFDVNALPRKESTRLIDLFAN
jgi:hypothetical protein